MSEDDKLEAMKYYMGLTPEANKSYLGPIETWIEHQEELGHSFISHEYNVQWSPDTLSTVYEHPGYHGELDKFEVEDKDALGNEAAWVQIIAAWFEQVCDLHPCYWGLSDSELFQAGALQGEHTETLIIDDPKEGNALTLQHLMDMVSNLDVHPAPNVIYLSKRQAQVLMDKLKEGNDIETPSFLVGDEIAIAGIKVKIV